MSRQLFFIISAIVLCCCITACETTPRTEAERQSLQDDARMALREFTARDQTMQAILNQSHGYAIFPRVGKGGLGIGGAYGRGVVYERGNLIGYSDLTQGTIGAQIGGQEYRQIIIFENESALRRFTRGQFAMAAHASGIVASEGASEAADFTEGVMVFTIGIGGLMGEASIGGQNFNFEPVRSSGN